jgi:hypothetical protein
MRYECILRYGINSGHEYRFAALTRRENGAIHECERMVEMTVANMVDHAGLGGRVVQGAHPTDPNAVVVALMRDGGVTYKTVTYRPVDRTPTPDDGLGDALLASLYALA